MKSQRTNPRENHSRCLNPQTNIDALRHQFLNHKTSKVRTREHKHPQKHTFTRTLTLTHTCRVISFSIFNETQRKRMLHRIETSHCRQKKLCHRQEHDETSARTRFQRQKRKPPCTKPQVTVWNERNPCPMTSQTVHIHN